VRLISHFWESPLHFNASCQGDYMGLQRGFPLPDCDTLFNWSIAA